MKKPIESSYPETKSNYRRKAESIIREKTKRQDPVRPAVRNEKTRF